MSYSKDLQNIVDQYRAAGRPWPADSKSIGAWAIANDLWVFTESQALKKCAQDISRAMREEYDTDYRGRRVRRKHSVTTKINGRQKTIWDDMETAPREHMEMAFQQRRRGIVGDCAQLKTDVDSYNERNPESEPVQVIFDFTYDLEEMEDELDEAA